MDYTFITIPVITSIIYTIIELIKKAVGKNEKFDKFVPLIAAVLGIVAGIICFYCVPGVIVTDNIVVAIMIGAASGLAATGTDQIIKQLKKSDEE